MPRHVHEQTALLCPVFSAPPATCRPIWCRRNAGLVKMQVPYQTRCPQKHFDRHQIGTSGKERRAAYSAAQQRLVRVFGGVPSQNSGKWLTFKSDGETKGAYEVIEQGLILLFMARRVSHSGH